MKFQTIKKHLSKKASAYSVPEIIMYLMIALFLLAGLGYQFYNASNSSKLTEMQSNLIVLRSQINQIFSGSSSYDDLENDIAIKAGAVPEIFIKGSSLINQWGGDITLSSALDGAAFTIELEEIPSKICTQLASFQVDSWISVEINGTNISENSVSILTNACDNDENTIVFTAR